MIALLAAAAAAAQAAPPLMPSLCKPEEVPLFTCPLHRKIASVCAISGKATYRYGTPSRVELTSIALHIANRGTSGGGETQISFAKDGFSYIVYDKTTRTSFGNGGSDPDFVAGLVVRKNGRTVSSSTCDRDASIVARARQIIPEGPFLDH